jgi:hypothetical protein
MRTRFAIPSLALLGALACNPPNLYETQAGFQPRSQAYKIVRLEGAGQREPMPSRWGLIDQTELHRVLQPVAAAEGYDMVFFEKRNGSYEGGAGTYLWTDLPSPRRGSGSSNERVRLYLEQFGKAPLVKLQPGAPDFGCPCALHSVKEAPIQHEGSVGHEAMGFQRVGDLELGFYLAVIHRAKGKPGEDMQVVVLQVAPGERFKDLVNDARKLGRRVRWHD